MSIRDVGFEIRAARHKSKRTLNETALLAGISSGFLSKVERGCAIPSLATLRNIATVLGVSTWDLLKNLPDESADLVRRN